MPIKFHELKHKSTPEALAAVDRRAAGALQTMALHELRRARRQTQKTLAATMGVDQSEVSRIEARSELRLGTLSEYVRALGGKLELRAVFPENTIHVVVPSAK